MTDQRVQEMYIAAPAYRVEDEPRFPDVLTAPGIDLAALMAVYHDTEPVFVIRPLAILDEVSVNGLPYNRAIVEDTYQQVLTRHPVARRGHIPKVDEGSSFPPDEGYWVGAVMDSTVYGKLAVFGKCYVVPGPTRDMVLSRRATGTPLSNSLWGKMKWAEDAHGAMQPVSIQIESIDFVPEERAALQALGGDFVVTSEMEGLLTDHDADDKAADKARLQEMIAKAQPEDLHNSLSAAGHAHRLAEMHLKASGCAECTSGAMHEMLTGPARRALSEAYLREEVTPEETYTWLSPAQRQQVAESHCKEMKLTMTPAEEAQAKATTVAEMTAQLSEMTALQTRLAEMERTVKEQQAIIQRNEREKFERTLSEAIGGKFDHIVVRTDDGRRKIGSLKATLHMRTVAEMAGSTKIEDVTPAVTRAYDDPDFKPLVEMTLASLGGPSALTGVAASGNHSAVEQYGFDPKTGRYAPDAAGAARAKANW